MPSLPTPPLNREPDLQTLISSFITTKDLKPYDRNHCPHPIISATTHKVIVDGQVTKPISLSISNLKNDFPQQELTCALQCAGNRRHTMRTLLKEVQGLDWFAGAVMNCTWKGPRLRDVLSRAGLDLTDDEAQTAHVAFACNAVPCQDDDWYGASIPLSRAMREDAEVILALEMNGEPLTVEHGFPVRVITPGIAGARAVKWLDHITVQKQMSSNHYMHFDYKVLPEDAVDSESAKKYWATTPPVIEMPVNSVVAAPADGSTVQTGSDGKVIVKGYALPSGDDGPIVKVEVSSDGENWIEARLSSHASESKWSWKLWEARIEVEKGDGKAIYSRATDGAGNVQPRVSRWNLRGVCYDGYGEARDLKVQ